jgi:hypothetical protein
MSMSNKTDTTVLAEGRNGRVYDRHGDCEYVMTSAQARARGQALLGAADEAEKPDPEMTADDVLAWELFNASEQATFGKEHTAAPFQTWNRREKQEGRAMAARARELLTKGGPT